MANVNSPFGLRPVGNGVAGTAPRITKYTRSTTGAIGEGAVVHLAATGPAVAADNTMDPGVIGVTAHFVGTNDTEVYVYDDPNQEFIVQGDSAVTTPISIIGLYGQLVDATTYNATNGDSSVQLDTSEVSSVRADGFVLQVVRPWDSPDNDQDAADAKWVVKITHLSHLLSGDTAAA